MKHRNFYKSFSRLLILYIEKTKTIKTHQLYTVQCTQSFIVLQNNILNSIRFDVFDIHTLDILIIILFSFFLLCRRLRSLTFINLCELLIKCKFIQKKEEKKKIHLLQLSDSLYSITNNFLINLTMLYIERQIDILNLYIFKLNIFNYKHMLINMLCEIEFEKN